MASARIRQTWADGTELEVEVYADSSFPDAVAEVRAACRILWADVAVAES